MLGASSSRPHMSEQPLADEPVILPAPLEQQLEAIVEEALGSAPLVATLPVLEELDDDAARRRVVITGLGVVSPVGIGLETFWDSISTGRSGIDYFTMIPNFRAY